MDTTPHPRIGADRLGRIGDLLTRHYGSKYDQYLTRVRNPLAILIAAAACSALCGLYLHPQGFVLAFGISAVVAFGVIWPRMSVSGVRGSLSFDRSRVVEGEVVVTRIRLSNRLPWSVWGVTIDSGLNGDGQAVGVSLVPGRGTAEASWDFVPNRRGEYPLGDPSIATGFPFGLWRAARVLSVENSVLAWPRTFPVGPIPDMAHGRGDAGAVHRDRVGTSGDILGLRHYRRGDPLRRVHWPQTAKHGRLIVSELQSEALPVVQIVLDVDQAVHIGHGPRSSREWAIRIAASLLSGWTGRGAEVEAILDGRKLAPADRSMQARQAKFLDALALIHSETTSTLAETFELEAFLEFVGLRVVITTDIALARLAQRRPRGIAERFIVLKASAFDGSGEHNVRAPEPIPLRPWILVDEPDRIPQIISRALKEESRG